MEFDGPGADEDFGLEQVEFVRTGLLDVAARPQRLRRFIPEKLPGGRSGLTFQFSGVRDQ